MSSADTSRVVAEVRTGFGLAWLKNWAVLRVTGTDAAGFLQNRLTNDVIALQPGQGQLNAVLDRQAKIQGIFGLYRDDPDFRLVLDAAERENAIAQILKFRILEQVQIEDLSATVSIFSLQGPKSAIFLKQLLPAQPLPTQEHAWVADQLDNEQASPVWLIRRSLSGEQGFLLLVETEQPEAVKDFLAQKAEAAGGINIPAEAVEVLRIEAGIPRFGLDYDFETLLPETGLERQTVNYSKGCYLGQETVARIKTYGMVQKALVGLLFDASLTAMPPAPAEIFLEDKPAGIITSVVFSLTLNRPIALAYLGKSERIPGKTMNLTIADQTYSAQVALLPFHDAQTQHTGSSLLEEGLKLFADGYDEEAIQQLKNAIALQPDLVEAHEALGVILSRQERYHEAIEMMEGVLALQPEHVLAHTNLSVFYMKLGDKEKAEEEKAKATMAAFSQKAKASGLVFDLEAERRKKEQATLERISMFQDALKYSPEDPLGNFGLGSAYLKLKRYSEAIEPFQRVIQVQPKHSVAYLSLGKAFEGAQQSQQARETYEKGIEVAAAKGDLMPLKEMQTRLAHLSETGSIKS